MVGEAINPPDTMGIETQGSWDVFGCISYFLVQVCNLPILNEETGIILVFR